MRFLLLAFFLTTTASLSFGDSCWETYGTDTADTSKGPCTPDPGEDTDRAKQRIINLIKRAKKRDADIATLKANWLAIKQSTTESDREKRWEAVQPFYAAKTAQEKLYNDALKETAVLYHVGPDTKNKTVAKPYDPALRWISGLKAEWNPRVTDSGPGINLAVKIAGNEPRDHYLGMTKMDPYADSGVEGVTLPDGRVYICAGTFDLALETTDSNGNQGNLGFLASVLYHESRHFNHLSRPSRGRKGELRSWASKQEEERDAYTDQDAASVIFELNKDDAQSIKDNKADNARLANSKSTRTSYGLTEKEEKPWEILYTTEQVNLEDDYNGLKAAVEKARQEQEKAAADEAAARQRQQEAARNAATTPKIDPKEAIKRCGFDFVYEPSLSRGGDPNTLLFKGFKAVDDSEHHLYNFPSVKTFPELEVVLMLAHACTAVSTGRVSRVDPPCNGDGLALLKDHLDDPAFLQKISAKVTVRNDIRDHMDDEELNYPCVAEKLSKLRFPFDERQFESIFESEAKANAKLNATELLRENEKTRWRRAEEAYQEPGSDVHRSIPPPPPKPCAASRPGGVCVWWSN